MSEHLTHQRLDDKFENNFDLTNFAIKSAKKSIADGEPQTLDSVLVELENLPDIEQGVSYA